MMITYTFAPRFVPLVAAGAIRQAFWPPRDHRAGQRHAQPGEPILLLDERSNLPIAPAAICMSILRMDITWSANRITRIHEGHVPLLRLDDCARRLGYYDLEDMATDFAQLYGPRFIEGYVVEWRLATTAALELEVA